MRGTDCSLEAPGALQPVRVPRWALLRLLLIMVDAAKAGANDTGRAAATLHLSSDERVVRLRASARDVEGGYATEMASLCGGVLAREADDLVLTLPALAELRRRERANPGS
jgi:hypothetical protein